MAVKYIQITVVVNHSIVDVRFDKKPKIKTFLYTTYNYLDRVVHPIYFL